MNIFKGIYAVGILTVIIIQNTQCNSSEYHREVLHRDSRGNIIGIKNFGENVNVGFDFILPFLRVATKRQENEIDEVSFFIFSKAFIFSN